MAKAKQQVYTQSGYDALIKELNERKNVTREEIKEKIEVARSFGDLSENSEYDEARDEQAKNEAYIKELEELIDNAVVVDEASIDSSVVSVGSTVTFTADHDLFGDETIEENGGDFEYTFHVVGSKQVNPLENKISDQSVIGKALIGARADNEREYALPDGTVVKLRIKEVTRTPHIN